MRPRNRLLPSRIVLVAVALCASARADVNHWSSVGPVLGPYNPGVAVNSVVIDPAVPSTVYATAGSGVYRSTDSGSAWRYLSRLWGGHSSLAAAASSPAALYAATIFGLMKSTNGGETWTPKLQGTFYAVAVDPHNPDFVYAGRSGTQTGTIFRSTDAGASWQLASGGFNASTVSFLVVNPAFPSTLYAAGYPTTGDPSSGGLFKSVDSGASWFPAGNGLPGRYASALAIDPLTTSTLYAVASGGSSTIYKSTNGGDTWSGVNSGLSSFPAQSLAIDPGMPSTVYAGAAFGVFKSLDGGASWAGASSGLSSRGVLALAIDPRSPSRIHAGTTVGISRSEDGGASWSGIDPAFARPQVGTLRVDRLSRIYAAAWPVGGIDGEGGIGIYKSSDGAATWSLSNNGFGNGLVTAIAPDPVSADTVYAGLDPEGLFKTTNAGATWLNPGGFSVPFGGVAAIAVDPVSATLYVGTPTGVFRSINGGQNWTEATNGFPPPGSRGVSALATDPVSPFTLYAGLSTGLFKSTNGSQSWSKIHDGPAGTIVVDPANHLTIYCATAGHFVGTAPALAPEPEAASAVDNVFKSLDGGATWTAANGGISTLSVSALAIDPSAPSTVFAGTSAGVFRSLNGGESWLPLNDGLTDLYVLSLAVDPNAPSTLYAGTNSRGVFKITHDPTAGTCSPGSSVLCLDANRFRVEVSWRAQQSGQSGVGQAIPLVANTGAFWFFDPTNLELVVKVLDGRSVNGKFWVFYGSLTNVEFTLTVTDTLTGAVKTYLNPQGQMASFADTSAF